MIHEGPSRGRQEGRVRDTGVTTEVRSGRELLMMLCHQLWMQKGGK